MIFKTSQVGENISYASCLLIYLFGDLLSTHLKIMHVDLRLCTISFFFYHISGDSSEQNNCERMYILSGNEIRGCTVACISKNKYIYRFKRVAGFMPWYQNRNLFSLVATAVYFFVLKTPNHLGVCLPCAYICSLIYLSIKIILIT